MADWKKRATDANQKAGAALLQLARGKDELTRVNLKQNELGCR